MHEDSRAASGREPAGRRPAAETERADPPTSDGAAGSEGGGVRVDSAGSSDLIGRLAGRRAAFGRYRIEREIAKGGMGAILRVWDVDIRRRLAMKVALGQEERGRTSQRMISRFVEEAQITGQLDHPGIVPVHELGIDDRGRLYFTMQLVRGRDLEQILEQVHGGEDEEWNQTRAVNVLQRVCEAMAYAHSKGVIHRDLKPANVMVGRFGEVYVMDWGLARIVHLEGEPPPRAADEEDSSPSRFEVQSDRDDQRSSRTGTGLVTLVGEVMGTPTYMSPEQARGDVDTMGPATDVYSAGSILYHLLAGHMPYAEPGAPLAAVEVWKRVKAGPPASIHERAPDAPAELAAICERAMAREPAERYATMLDMARDLRAYLEGRVVKAYETGAVAEFRKWVARNRALATTALVAGVVIVTGLSAASWILARKNEQLQVKTDEAVASARLAEDRRSKVLRLSDVKRAQQLETEAGTLWPAYPQRIGDLRAWLAAARELVGRAGEHRAELERLRGAGHSTPGPDGEPVFDSAEDQWQHDTLVDLLRRLDALAAPGTGLIDAVAGRLDFAEHVAERTVDGPAARAAWDAALASIADPADCPLYGGLELAPQLGLLPLRRDPATGLWEFAHLQTGAPPELDPDTGEPVVADGTGLVFVLIPGGPARLGRPVGPQGEEEPASPGVLDLPLAPYFLSKYELTQGQWLRFTGENPSRYQPGQTFAGRTIGLVNPVDQVTWEDCQRVLAQLDLELPTEAQWEHAARAGTDTDWWTGAERESLRGRANLADQSAAREGANWPAIADWPALDDGYAVHAPVDTFGPNPFGLYDVHGNVWEWCREPYAPGYGEELTELRTARGGSFQHSAALARSSYRNPTAADLRTASLGLRPARAVRDR